MQQIRQMPARPAETDQLLDKVTWLLMTHGYDQRTHRVVQLFEPSAYCSITLDAFKTEYAAWFEMVPTAPGKTKRVNAWQVWMDHTRRISIAGVRMHPGKNFPLYMGDDGVSVFKNTYRQPEHIDDGTGDVQPFLDFMDKFLPDPIERNWQLDWMAHKLLRPDIPGISPWFVADVEGGPLGGKFGVGRGMLFRILAKLYGEAYCKAEDFDILAGTSAQAVYTDWQAYSILVMVDEAHTSPTAYRRGEKRSVYTSLKNCIDPAPRRRTFKIKGLQAFDGVSFCSVCVATNHANATAIPANDRRITVLRNGREMTPAEAVAIDAWMAVPANIAALSAYLESSDLSQFNMFTPLATAAKKEMADLSLNEVENALIDFASDPDRGLVFPRIFLERAMEAHMNGGEERMGPRDRAWQGQLAGAFDEHCAVLKTASGDKARLRVNGQRYIVYAFRSRMAEAQVLTETQRREHASRWGHIDAMQTVLRDVK